MDNSKKQVSVLFMLFSILFCVCLIAANILETKQISVLGISLTGGLIVFPVSYIINDCVCEVWGYGKARLLIWTGFAMNFFFVATGAICDAIPGAPYWNNDAGFHAIFGLAPRRDYSVTTGRQSKSKTSPAPTLSCPKEMCMK